MKKYKNTETIPSTSIRETNIWNETMKVNFFNKIKASGKVKAICFVGGFLSIIGLGTLCIKSKLKKNEQAGETECSIAEHHEQSADDIEKNHQDSQDKIQEENNKADNEIRILQAKTECELKEYAGKKEVDLNHKLKMKQAGLLDGIGIPTDTVVPTLASFEEGFQRAHPFPEVPDILKPIFAGIPAGYETGMLLHFSSMFGALCFSRVRATYLDGTLEGPNLHVVVSGPAGSGKSKFDALFHSVFKDVITTESFKCQSQGKNRKIIQIIGPDISEARLVELLSTNQGTHLYLLATEITDMRNKLNKQGGLTYTDIRKSLGGEMVSHMTREKGGAQGQYQMLLNSTLTGTPHEVERFFKGEIETGTAQRFCFTSIPASGEIPPMLVLPDNTVMETIRKQIEVWRNEYCYTIGSCSGDETACDITNIDLGYLCEQLSVWLKGQWTLAGNEPDGYLKDLRISIRNRRACIAFHCGIVLHMLWEQPEDEEIRRKVVDAALYIADYITESYLYTISKMERGFYRMVSSSNENGNPARRQFTEDEIAEMAKLHNILDDKGQHKYGWDTLAAMFNTSCSTVKRKVKDYENRHENDNN